MTPCPERHSEGSTHFTRPVCFVKFYSSMNAGSPISSFYGNGGMKFQKT